MPETAGMSFTETGRGLVESTGAPASLPKSPFADEKITDLTALTSAPDTPKTTDPFPNSDPPRLAVTVPLTCWLAGKLEMEMELPIVTFPTVTVTLSKAARLLASKATVTVLDTVTVLANAPLMTAWLNVTTEGVSVIDR